MNYFLLFRISTYFFSVKKIFVCDRYDFNPYCKNSNRQSQQKLETNNPSGIFQVFSIQFLTIAVDNWQSQYYISLQYAQGRLGIMAHNIHSVAYPMSYFDKNQDRLFLRT